MRNVDILERLDYKWPFSALSGCMLLGRGKTVMLEDLDNL